MKKENKKEIVYNPTVMFKNFIIYQLFFLYITLMIGDSVSLGAEFSNLVTRYLPIAVVTFISAFLIFKKYISKCFIKDKEEVKKKVVVAPIIVAVILLGYGLYSVESNMSEIRKKLNSSLFYQNSFSSSSVFDEAIKQEMDKAASEARVNWLITSIIYLVVAESVAFMVNKKLDEWLKEEEIVSEKTDNELLYNTSLNVEETKEVDVNNEVPLNNIKWDL